MHVQSFVRDSAKYNACYKADMISISDPTARIRGRKITSDCLRARDERSSLRYHGVSLITDVQPAASAVTRWTKYCA